MSTHGHFWTIVPWLAHRLRALQPPPFDHWQTTVEDETYGALRLSGALCSAPGGSNVIVIVHGLGGCADSHYVVDLARQAFDRGMDNLRISLRGADRSGEDIYHAGLIADLVACVDALAQRYDSISLLGYSLGGHVCMRYAALNPHPSVKAVAAICPPLDLSKTALAFDTQANRFYRAYILRHLREIYAEVLKKRQLQLPLADAKKIRSIRQWDEQIVAPRFGFADAADYYQKMSVAPLLARIEIPTLLVIAEQDPMVLTSAIPAQLRRELEQLSQSSSSPFALRVVDRGGHVGFPRNIDLGMDGPPGVSRQVLAFLARQIDQIAA